MKNLWFVLLFPLLFSPSTVAQTPISFDHIFDNTFSPKDIGQVRWMREGSFYSALEREANLQVLRRYDIKDGSSMVLSSSKDWVWQGDTLGVQNYSFSSDERKLLLQTDVERLWRRSTKAQFFVYDLGSKKLSKLSKQSEKQSYATFSPSGDKVVYFRDNNIYLVDLASGSETPITQDGEFGRIINGAADWVYEEEFSFAKAFFWSPDGKFVAFYRFDESEVPLFQMMLWDSPYPKTTDFKYPKAGEKNSIVKIGVFDISEGKTRWMDVGSETDQYIVRVNWTQTSERLSIRRMNRLQNQQDLLLANVITGESRLLKKETSSTWIDENDDLTFLANKKQFIYVSEADSFNHIYLYNMKGEVERQITKGAWEVTRFYGFDPKSRFMYYQSTEEGSTQRHLYRIRIDGKKKERLSQGPGWHTADFSPDLSVYISRFSAPKQPTVVTLRKNDGTQIRLLEDNADLKAKIAKTRWPKTEYANVPGGDGTPLNSYFIYPSDFDSISGKQYPVLVYVYGGPGSQNVAERFGSGQRWMWHRYMAEQGYIIACFDNRGTGARGADFKKQVYKQLGKLEVEDQIAAATFMAEKSYVDANRIGIWGWSYGGYMSTLSLEKGADVYAAAMAVAPVTHWKFYDTIYTERFMQTPQLNPEGYENGAPLNFVKAIKDPYLLIHGTGDDNVHFQNTIELNEALVQAGIPFQTMIYRNRSHGISGGNTRRHLHELMTRFIKENL